MKFPVILASALLACKAFAADLRIEDRDLPRVPATEPGRAVSTLQVRDGFHAELVASEPLIADPVTITFDENGRLFVVEMGDYSERREEKLGRIKLLEDTDGDGRFDKATLYATNLAWPTAVICYDGGTFVGASPDILYLKDTNGDGVADVRRLVFTGFGTATSKLNVQQLLNSFTWGLDNRIHGALGGNASVVTNIAAQVGRGVLSAPGTSLAPGGAVRASRPTSYVLELHGRDFSFDPRTFELRAESGGGQWGMSFDDEGNKFVCNNSRHIAVEMYEDRDAARSRFYSMPAPDVSIAADGPAAEVFRISPDEPWRVIRTKWRVAGLVSGPVEGGGRPSGYFTGAAGAMIYRGDAFPPAFRGDAFIADCGSNLVHRKKIHRAGLDFVAERAPDEQRREFLASRDNWFRPVSFANAPDGTLYVVDMYRETIEHPWSLPPELKSKLDLNSGNDRGRIYRVVPDDFKQPKPARFGDAGTAELVQTLEHPNGWHRDTAARLLFERRETNAVPLLRNLVSDSKSNSGRMLALSALVSAQAVRSEDWKKALMDRESVVRVHAIRSASAFLQTNLPGMDANKWSSALQTAADDPDIRVRFQAALASSDPVALTKIIARDIEQPWMRAAVLGGLSGGAAEVFAALVADKSFNQREGALRFLREAAQIAGASAALNRVALDLRVAKSSPDLLALASAFAAGLERRNATLLNVDPTLANQLTVQARRASVDPVQSESRRIEAAEFLGTSRDPASRTALMALLAASEPPSLQSAAILALGRRRDNTITNVLARWTQLAPATRAKAIDLLLARRDSSMALLQAVEQGTVARRELAAADVQRLTANRNGPVRDKARLIFQRDNSARSEVVKKWKPALDLKGDAERGHAIYLQRCAACHRAGQDGFMVGPDLASVASNGKEKLLVSILDPNAEVASPYVAYALETKHGESLLGLLAGEQSEAVTLKLPGAKIVRLGRDDVFSMRASDQSLMPEGLEEGLSAPALADLLEFVTQAKPAP